MRKEILKKLHLWGTYRRITLFRVNVLLAGTKEKSFEKKRRLLNRLDGIVIGEGTRVVGPLQVLGTLKVGKNCWCGKNLLVNGNGTVTIGDNCDIGPEVTFQTGGHVLGSAERRAGAGLTFQQTVGNGCWIGGRSTFLNDVTVGDGSVIAGCACVIKDIPSNILAGGVPARKLRDLDNEYTDIAEK